MKGARLVVSLSTVHFTSLMKPSHIPRISEKSQFLCQAGPYFFSLLHLYNTFYLCTYPILASKAFPFSTWISSFTRLKHLSRELPVSIPLYRELPSLYCILKTSKKLKKKKKLTNQLFLNSSDK